MLLLLSLAFYVFRDVTFPYKHLTKSFFRAKVPDPRRQTRGESLVFRSKYLDASYFPAVLRAFLARSPVGARAAVRLRFRLCVSMQRPKEEE